MSHSIALFLSSLSLSHTYCPSQLSRSLLSAHSHSLKRNLSRQHPLFIVVLIPFCWFTLFLAHAPNYSNQLFPISHTNTYKPFRWAISLSYTFLPSSYRKTTAMESDFGFDEYIISNTYTDVPKLESYDAQLYPSGNEMTHKLYYSILI